MIFKSTNNYLRHSRSGHYLVWRFYKNDKDHRENNKAAIIWSDGFKRYYVDGEYIGRSFDSEIKKEIKPG